MCGGGGGGGGGGVCGGGGGADGVSGNATPIMIHSIPSNSNHEPMQMRHKRIPITTSLEQPTPSINENFILITTT